MSKKNVKEPQQEKTVSILTLGETQVGKTSLILRFIDRVFYYDTKTTIGVDFKVKRINLLNKNVLVKIWDSAGQERFKTVTRQYYKNAEGVMLIYDVTSQKSFSMIEEWFKSIIENKRKGAQVILIGNKKDMVNRVISAEQGESLAKKFEIKYYETSALSGENVDQVFEELAENILKIKLNTEEEESISLSYNSERDGKKKNSEKDRDKKQPCC